MIISVSFQYLSSSNPVWAWLCCNLHLKMAILLLNVSPSSRGKTSGRQILSRPAHGGQPYIRGLVHDYLNFASCILSCFIPTFSLVTCIFKCSLAKVIWHTKVLYFRDFSRHNKEITEYFSRTLAQFKDFSRRWLKI